MHDGRTGTIVTRHGDATLADAVVTLSDVEQRLTRGLAAALAESQATVEQWRLLELVDALDAPTMGELAAESGLPGSSLSRTVDALEDDASVYRLADAADRRRITVRLSDHGASRLDAMRAIVAAWDARMRAVLGADVVARLTAATGEAAGRLDAGETRG